jgi:nitrate reductase delta subunit
MTIQLTDSLLRSFADLLDYPTPQVYQQAEACLAELRAVPEAAQALDVFQCGIENLSLERMQELYTVTFDMQPLCYPYIGYHLFGESYKRGAFMAQLNETYHDHDFCPQQELPDHLPVALRFLGLEPARCKDDFGRALIVEGLLPALTKMLQVFNQQTENPYASLLAALQLVLTPEKELTHA